MVATVCEQMDAVGAHFVGLVEALQVSQKDLQV